MTNSKELFNELVNRVRLHETRDEIQSIIYLLLEEKLGLTKTDVMMGKEVKLTNPDIFNEILQRINQQEPIQYILGQAEFYGRSFAVDGSVLIPRPETELLIREVLKEHSTGPVVLDIGTGSGCIAVTLALELPSAKVYAIDISEDALSIARRNAECLQANVLFLKTDILANVSLDHQFDFIVSNPPYIAESEGKHMNPNVLNFEPHQALFVSDEDPLIFYRRIAHLGKSTLKVKGKIFLEINERFGQELSNLFRSEGYKSVIIEKDFDGKDRVLVARM